MKLGARESEGAGRSWIARGSLEVNTQSTALLDCPVCQSRNWGPSITIRRAPLSACNDCGLLATEAFLAGPGRSLDALYDVSEDDRREYEAHYLAPRLATFRRLLPTLDRYRRGGRLLEIGSGYGHFLTLASARGWRAEGVEISGYASAFARRHGCNVHNAPLDELDLGTEAFDVIVMWDVIEHFERPLHVIARCHSMLRPGGALTLKTPDARALDGPAGMLRRLYRQFVYPANTAEHYFHYTPNALQRVLATAGFSEFQVDERDEWEERVISGRNPVVRGVRYAIMRYAFSAAWPYEFVITAVKR